MRIRLSDIIKYGIIIILGVFTIQKGINPGFQNKAADFNNYFVASKLVVEGYDVHQFYNNAWFNEQAKAIGIEAGAKFSPFPPATAYIFVPLTLFTPIQAQRLWVVVNCFLVILIGLKAKKHLKTSLLNAFLFVFIFTIPIVNCIHFGQIYLLLAYILTWAVLGVAGRYQLVFSAVLLGIAALVKYLPLLFSLYFYQHFQNKKIWLVTIFTIVLVCTIIYFVDPFVYQSYYSILTSHLRGNLSGQGKFAIGFQSIDSLLNNLFVYDKYENPLPLANFPILKPILKIFFMISIGVILLFLYKKSKYKLNSVLISIGIIGIFTTFPATASYHFLLLFLPLLYISKWLLAFQRQYIIFLMAVIAAFSVQFIHIPNFNSLPVFNLIVHYPRFWCLLFVFLFLSYQYSKLNMVKHG
jgi:hypothetical protein